MRDDDPGVQVGGRQLHDDRVDVGEAAQREALVLDAVLRAHDATSGPAAASSAPARLGVLTLHRHITSSSARQAISSGPPTTGTARRMCPGRLAAQPGALDRVAMGAAGDQHDLVAVLEQAAADHTPDCAGTVDDDARQEVPSYSKAACPVSALPSTSVWI